MNQFQDKVVIGTSGAQGNGKRIAARPHTDGRYAPY